MDGYQVYSDWELMSLITGDDSKAFEEVYRRYKSPLYSHAYKMLNDREEAQDALHDVFAALWSKRYSIVLESNLSAYLYKAVRYRILNIIARKKRGSHYLTSLAHFIEHGENVTESLVMRNEMGNLIEREIALLPPKMREVFKMNVEENLSYVEIAETLGISDKTVRKQVYNARAILRSKLIGFVILMLWVLEGTTG